MLNNLVLGSWPWAGSQGRAVWQDQVSPHLPERAPLLSSSHCSFCIGAFRGHSEAALDIPGQPACRGPAPRPQAWAPTLAQNCSRARLEWSTDLVRISCAVGVTVG